MTVTSLILIAPLLAATGSSGRQASFVDVAEKTGLDFVHFNGMTGALYFPEMTGQGGALLDFDNDGDLDVYLVDGATLGKDDSLDDALFAPKRPGPPRDRLFRNDLDATTGELRFVDVTEASGIEAFGYGMGVATGDIDNDGLVDIYVTNYGPNQLFHNRGGGRFEDITSEAGVSESAWSTSAAFFDYDADGFLDLFIANYVSYDVDAGKRCYAPTSAQDYCGPADYPPVPDRLFRNLGNGQFEDVSQSAFTSRELGPGLGVVTADFNRDGAIDIYVANDGAANQLWMNRANGTFTNEALFAGVGVNWMGRPEASMGVDAADFDGDGDDDLFMTHLTDETNTLFVNDGAGLFEDQTLASGLGAASVAMTAFGTAWLDYDNDGDLDLLVLNGAVKRLEALAREGDLFPLDQPNQLFHNTGGRFEEVTDHAGPVFAFSEVSRGAAFGDVDNDGDTDVLVLNNNGRARLLSNQAAGGNHWLGLRLVGSGSGERDMLGARVEVVLADGRTVWRRSRTDGSYCSANDPRVLVGLGNEDRVTTVRVHWPSGRDERWDWTASGVDRYTTLREGEGEGRGGGSEP